MTITLAALGITAELVLESQRRIAQSGRRNLDMSVDLAFDQIRLDVRSSLGFDVPPGMAGLFNNGAGEPLFIEGHYSGDTIGYELVGSELRRSVYKGIDFNPVAQRVVLKQVKRFQWRSRVETSVLEMIITHEETAAMTRRIAAGQREVMEPAVRTMNLMVAPRDVLPIQEKKTW